MLSETLVQLIAGALAVPVCQLVKKVFRLEGTAMLWAAVLISFGLAIVVSLLTAGTAGIAALIANPTMLLTGTGLIFGTAQVLFRSVKEKMGLQLPGETPESGS